MSLAKSQMFFSNNVNNDFADTLARRAGIATTKDLGRYLGVPSIHKRVTITMFSNVMERIKARLEGWKAKYLSLAGRQVMAQFT